MRPQPGDLVFIDGLPGTFTVESFDGSLFTLRSSYGVALKAGCQMVHRVAQREVEAA